MGNASKTLTIQIVLYKNSAAEVKFSLQSLANAIELVKQANLLGYVEIKYGDCSPAQILTNEDVSVTKKSYSFVDEFSYVFFGNNLGFGGGHNALMSNVNSEYLLILNPDAAVAPNALIELVKGFSQPDIGVVEARQIPIEHPKDYDDFTGETSWASGACFMTKTRLAKLIKGFDDKTFFLYCEDVDFSWRMRLAGYKVIFRPTATVFHDKRLDDDGVCIASAAEEYYSAESALLLAYKYSRNDVLERILKDFRERGGYHHKKALIEFENRRKRKKLPTPIDIDNKVAQFIDGNYAAHRF